MLLLGGLNENFLEKICENFNFCKENLLIRFLRDTQNLFLNFCIRYINNLFFFFFFLREQCLWTVTPTVTLPFFLFKYHPNLKFHYLLIPSIIYLSKVSKMSHMIIKVAISYFIVAVVYVTYVPEEDRALLIGILAFIVPLVILAIGVDKIWKRWMM